MGKLKEEHLALYKRVRLKAIVHLALGFVLIFLPTTVPQSSAGTVTIHVQQALSFFGIVYMLIGLAITAGLIIQDAEYRFVRSALTIAAIYNSLWSLLLVAILIDKPNRSTAYIAVIYWYMTYNIWQVRNDPGWEAIKLVQEIRDDERSGISTIK
jgi:cytochrome c biogenesis protein CcdA